MSTRKIATTNRWETQLVGRVTWPLAGLSRTLALVAALNVGIYKFEAASNMPIRPVHGQPKSPHVSPPVREGGRSRFIEFMLTTASPGVPASDTPVDLERGLILVFFRARGAHFARGFLESCFFVRPHEFLIHPPRSGRVPLFTRE